MDALRVILLSLASLDKAPEGANPSTRVPKRYVSFVPRPEDVLAAHNFIRNKVGVPPLAWSDELAHVAQRWAERLMNDGIFVHSSEISYGENLYQLSGHGPTSTPFQVVSAWAAESDFYDYETNTCRRKCGHYKQVVWRTTKQVGCAVTRDDNREIWVCEYAPYGNIIGKRPY